MRAKSSFRFSYILFDALTVIISFIIVSLIRRGGIIEGKDYYSLMYVLFSNTLISYILGIYNQTSLNGFFEIINLFLSRIIMVLSLISISFIIIFNEPFSRFIIVNTVLLSSFVNILFSIRFFNIQENIDVLEKKERDKSLILIKIIDYLIFVALCLIICNKHKSIFQNDLQITLIGLIIFLLINNLEHKFKFKTYKNLWFFQWHHIKTNILFIGSFITILLLFYDKSLVLVSKFNIIIFLFSLIDFILTSLFYFNKKTIEKYEIDKSRIIKANIVEEIFSVHNNKVNQKYSFSNNYNYYLAQSLTEVYLKNYSDVYRFIENQIDLFSFDFRRAVIIRSADTYNIEVIPNGTLEFYLNLHKINDFRRVNEYFLKVKEALVYGGIFIGNFEPSELRIKKIRNSYPKYIAKVIYILDFIWKRIFPKIPFLKYFYFELTKGKERVFSIAEILGRLHFCGFNVLSINQIEDKVYFIAKKNGNDKIKQVPTYGPLVKLKRVGKGGNAIWVYKFRTMSPYSEFLQEYIFENFNLKKGGKFYNDFRITSWGKLLRKLWLDELPMFINYFKGELKIVGVRPISFHYFNLYPKDFQERRIKYRPGLVPPFYYDLPKTLEEIVESERRYLDAYDKNPFLTDIRYFIGAFKNIIFKNARSA